MQNKQPVYRGLVELICFRRKYRQFNQSCGLVWFYTLYYNGL